ncbi:MAG: hypothetical protein ABI391_00230 [Hyphomicrobiaceae bacterium]
MSTRFAMAAAALVALLGAPLPASAQETGLAAIHQWVSVGRKTCMDSHYHDGNGTGKTKKDAERAAVLSWESFTIWEYGEPWGRYAASESKSVTCDMAADKSFSCHITSRPCVSKVAKRRKRR